ncbi:hypothetical protein MNAN1_001709 [Malassezia nana]|uniref:Uncharacterized protein n=1 Tax=Malassezia nana TaxID=180528 RepID=A0AAF0J2A4_9BASI|nr:hypothetical protein MNAN1_001709 [Malassezia nana]
MSRIWHLAPLLDDTASLYGEGMPQLLFENGLHHGRIFHVAVDATRVLAACEDKSVWIADYIGHDLKAPDLYYD